MVSIAPPNVVTAEVSAPAGIVASADEAQLALVEGVAKGGYPVDITSQSNVDLSNLVEPELVCASTLIEAGLEPAAAAQMEAGFTALDAPEAYGADPYSGDQDFPSSITEVIRPMEMAELVDILPTLSLIEEDIPSGPSTPSVMDMLESFGLGISEHHAYFNLQNPDLMGQAGCSSQPETENAASRGLDTSAGDASGGDTPTFSWDFPPDDAGNAALPGKAARYPMRNQVEWDQPTRSSS